MANKRTDIHRPGAIVPADYAIVTCYHLATTKPFNIEYVIELQNSKKFAATGSIGKCSICGTGFVYGDVWVHVPTGEHLHVGQDCATKYELLADRSAFELEADRRKAATARECQKAQNAEDRAAFLSAHAGLEDALKFDHPIVLDIADRFRRYCTLSDKQVALVMKIASEASRPEPAKEKLTNAPTADKRVTFRGRVVSAKSQDGYHGGTEYKMTIKVETPDGVWLAWGTVPNSMLESCPVGERGRLDSLRGAEVEVTAKLQAGRDPHFAIMKRPVGKVTQLCETAAKALEEEKAREVERQAALSYNCAREFAAIDNGTEF